MTETPNYTLTYNDTSHAYYLNGRRCKSVSKVAKIPTDTFALEKWGERMVAIGLATDNMLLENVAAHIDNDKRLNDICDDAKKAGRAHAAADRGTQMHRVLELILLDQEDRLLTAQQRADADVLKRTLDRYQLQPHQGMAEQFVIWPHYMVAGRFDAILQTPDNRLILCDLKSGPNAVKYPHSTAIQLALYARAPLMSNSIHAAGDKETITDWRELPQQLDRRRGYVMLVTPDDTVGELHELDIQHGWAAAQIALRAVEWRKQFNNGRDIATPVEPFTDQPAAATWETLIESAHTLDRLRELWLRAKQLGELTDEVKELAQRKAKELA